MVEVTLRTVQGRLLLRPDPPTTLIIAGVVARAQERTGMEVHAIVAMGNHLHFLLSPRDVRQLAAFMHHCASNIARRVGQLVGWRDKFWSRRYRSIVISNEAESQVARLRYLLAHGAKEGLVLDPTDWPGVHAANALASGTMEIRGAWFDGTAAYRDRVKGRERSRCAYTEPQTVRLAPLPCWRSLDPQEQRQNVVDLLDSIRDERRKPHSDAETKSAGIASVLTKDPHAVPRTIKRAPAPAFHAATRAAWLELRNAYAVFFAAYREAAARLKAGTRPATFPRGCFPPALPFVPG